MACRAQLHRRCAGGSVPRFSGPQPQVRHGFRGLVRGLEFVLALNQRFFPAYYPPIEDGGLDMRAGRLAELEGLLTQAIDASAMTAKVDGETHAFWEWKQIQILFTNASRAKPEK